MVIKYIYKSLLTWYDVIVVFFQLLQNIQLLKIGHSESYK